MSDPIMPKQDDRPYQPPTQTTPESQRPVSYGSAKPSGGGGSATVIIGLVMLVAGIGLSAAGTGRIFIGLIVVGVINIVRGLAR